MSGIADLLVARPANDNGPAMLPDSAATLHSQLKAIILAAIGSGEWPPHARIASERELCDRHGVSRTTARRAISDLVHEGVLYTVGGKGTFVASRPLRQELRLLVGFEEDLRSQGIDVRSAVIGVTRIEAGPDLAATLGLRPLAPVVRLRRLRLSRETPLAIQTSYLPEHLCPGLLHLDFTGRSLFRTLRDDYGLELVGGSTVIRAALADAEEARLLDLEPGAAVLRTDQVTLLAGGEVIELCASSFHSTHFELSSAAGGAGPGGLSPIYSVGRGERED